jgi:Ca2+-binding EF-hand superfamily protein
MVYGVNGTSSSGYLLQLMQASKGAGTSRSTSTDNVFSLFDAKREGSISKGELSSALSGSSSANSILASDSDSTASFVSFLESIAAATSENSAGSPGRLLREAIFKKIDTDGDGALSKMEFINGKPSDMTVTRADELYSKLDTNKDGLISQSEFITKGSEGPNGPSPNSMDNASGNSDSSGSIMSLVASGFKQALKYAAKSAVSAATGGILGIV